MTVNSVLIVSMKYDYGLPENGIGYEWNHFFLGLEPHFGQVVFFDFMSKLKELGKQGMQEALVDEVRRTSPDIVLFSLYTDQIEPWCVEEVRELAPTLCFFHDAQWRQAFVEEWAPHFDAFTTSDPLGVRAYERRGWHHAIYLPFGVNESLFAPDPGDGPEHDISFVGLRSPLREWLVSRLRKEGLTVSAFGSKWPDGRLSTEEMVRVFSRSRINLNLSNSASWDARYLLSSPRAVRNTLRSTKTAEQLKGRHHEIPACRGMQLSYYVDGLEHLYEIGDEIAVYLDPDDLVRKVRYYLQDDQERERIARAGHARVLREHTYAQRFRGAFERTLKLRGSQG